MSKYEEIKDRICRDNSIESVAISLGLTPYPKGNIIGLKESSSCAIYPATNTFCRFSNGVGGNVIAFLSEYAGITYKEAFTQLAKETKVYQHNTKEYKKKIAFTKKEFVLPKADKNNSCVIAYLVKTRGISIEVVKEMINKKMLYQDERRNCVFVGFSGEVPKFACKRSSSSTTKFVGDVAGSDYNVGWYINNCAKKLIVAESPIDIMSIMTILQQKSKNINEYNYLSTAGTGKLESVYRYTKENGITDLIIATDRDEAGIIANWKLQANISNVNIIRYLPTGKDFNDDLRGNIGVTQNVYKIETVDDIMYNRYCDPYVAETLKLLSIPIGKIIDNSTFEKNVDKRESWFVPLPVNFNFQEGFFNKNIIPVINPKYGEDKYISDLVETLSMISKHGLLQDLNKRLEGARVTPSLEAIKKMAIYLEEKNKSIANKLRSYDSQQTELPSTHIQTRNII